LSMDYWIRNAEDYEDVELTPATLKVLEMSRELAGIIADKIARLHESGSRGVLESIKARLSEREPLPGVAIDSTFPPEGGLELIGGRLIVVVAGYVCFAGARHSTLPCRDSFTRAWLVESEEHRRSVPLAAKVLEKALTLRLLRDVESGALNARLFLLDGEVIPYQLLFKPSARVSGSSLLSRLHKQSCSMLTRIRELGLSVAGVVKRSYSRLLSARLGEPLPLNDKAVMSVYLSPGEYAVIGSYGEVLPRYAEIMAAEKRMDPDRYRRIVEERISSCEAYGDVVVAFYKPPQPRRGSYAVKVEIYAPYMSPGDLLGSLSSLTNPATGLPYPIDIVDAYTRVEARVMELLRRRMAADLARRGLGEAARLVAHTNPEKRYLFEPGYRAS